MDAGDQRASDSEHDDIWERASGSEHKICRSMDGSCRERMIRNEVDRWVTLAVVRRRWEEVRLSIPLRPGHSPIDLDEQYQSRVAYEKEGKGGERTDG